MTRQKQAERQEALEKLRTMVQPGDTIQCILRHVSRSGMSRSISPIIGGQDVSYLVAKALDSRVDQRNGGVVMGGAGMDMGFALVYNLSRALYPDGFTCTHPGRTPYDVLDVSARCPSNDHSNEPRREFSEDELHSDGGYAVSMRWL